MQKMAYSQGKMSQIAKILHPGVAYDNVGEFSEGVEILYRFDKK